MVPEHVIESSRGKVKGKARERKERTERELQSLVKFMQEDVVPRCYLCVLFLRGFNSRSRTWRGYFVGKLLMSV